MVLEYVFTTQLLNISLYLYWEEKSMAVRRCRNTGWLVWRWTTPSPDEHWSCTLIIHSRLMCRFEFDVVFVPHRSSSHFKIRPLYSVTSIKLEENTGLLSVISILSIISIFLRMTLATEASNHWLYRLLFFILLTDEPWIWILKGWPPQPVIWKL